MSTVHHHMPCHHGLHNHLQHNDDGHEGHHNHTTHYNHQFDKFATTSTASLSQNSTAMMVTNDDEGSRVETHGEGLVTLFGPQVTFFSYILKFCLLKNFFLDCKWPTCTGMMMTMTDVRAQDA